MTFFTVIAYYSDDLINVISKSFHPSWMITISWPSDVQELITFIFLFAVEDDVGSQFVVFGRLYKDGGLF